ncbi:uncharacterized protein LOC103571826 isoform X2 [Microplitis demolitor]|uniref:uncharacterized protein LOC103571826 isoform X2 n=1 Tax=Microplitis demolitor TaxID=69319 RepID=UPI00235B64ED|nr:uncharacterized protein LOC103571826 isoform X2 [Microplitis demolitor]
MLVQNYLLCSDDNISAILGVRYRKLLYKTTRYNMLDFVSMRYFNHRVLRLPRDAKRQLVAVLGMLCEGCYPPLVALELMDKVEISIGLPAAFSDLYTFLEGVHESRVYQYSRARITLEEYNRPCYYPGELGLVEEIFHNVQNLLGSFFSRLV